MKFRKLLGEDGVEELLAQSINVAVELKLIKPQELTWVIVDSTVQEKAIAHPTAAAQAPATQAPGDIPAPLSGSLVAWHKQSGDKVAAGDVIAVMEAMKMETAIHAEHAGVLEHLAVEGEVLEAGQLMARVKTA